MPVNEIDTWIDQWNKRYSVEEFVYGQAPNEFLLENVHLIPGGNILCIADGEGRNSVWLARRGYQVTAIDYSIVALRKARKLADHHHKIIDFVQADLLEYDFGHNKYDGIVAIYSHFNHIDRLNLHRKYAQALKSDGIFLMENFSMNQLKHSSGGPKDIDLLYDCISIETGFPNFEIITLIEQIIVLDEGKLHQGKASVVRAILRKQNKC